MAVGQIQMLTDCEEGWTTPSPPHEADLITSYWQEIFPPDIVNWWTVCWAPDQVVYYRWVMVNPCCVGSGSVPGCQTMLCAVSSDPGNEIQQRQDGLWAPQGGSGGSPGPQGPPGPAGPTGPAGPQGTQGPAGPQGAAGTGINLKGSVPDAANLPPTGNTTGDGYITTDTGHLWVWEGGQWVDIGTIVGPAGPQGPQGPAGSQGPAGPTGPQGATGPTGAPGMVFVGESYLGSNYNFAANQNPTGGIFNLQINPTSGTQRYVLYVFGDIQKSTAQSSSYVQLQVYRLYDNKLMGKFNIFAESNTMVGGQASGVIITNDVPRPGGVTYYVDLVNVGDSGTLAAGASITAYTVGG